MNNEDVDDNANDGDIFDVQRCDLDDLNAKWGPWLVREFLGGKI